MSEFTYLTPRNRDIFQGSWLRHYTTSRKVADSIPDEVIGFFFSNFLTFLAPL
jgi:hypothetical protein